MRIDRAVLLKCLEAVSPGLAAREILEQSACFCFRDGTVQTFNDEVACTTACPLTVTGAVPAKPFLALLGKLAEPELDIAVANSLLTVKGKGRKADFRLEAELLLPTDTVEQPADDAWYELPADFCEAIDLVGQCASTDAAGDFGFTCIHIHPEYVEASDNYQLARYAIEVPVAEESLVRQSSLKHVVGLGVNAVAATPSWLHFRNAAGLVLSCRRYLEAYTDMTPFLTVPEGVKTSLPGGLAEAAAKAEIFSNENPEGNQLRINLSANRLAIVGQGASGRFEERQPVSYAGKPLDFLISPKLLASLTTRSQECEVGVGRLGMSIGAKIRYVALLIQTDLVGAV